MKTHACKWVFSLPLLTIEILFLCLINIKNISSEILQKYLQVVYMNFITVYLEFSYKNFTTFENIFYDCFTHFT